LLRVKPSFDSGDAGKKVNIVAQSESSKLKGAPLVIRYWLFGEMITHSAKRIGHPSEIPCGELRRSYFTGQGGHGAEMKD
jgi:hypothetical protein